MKLTQILLALTLSSAGLMAADEAAPEAKEIASNYKTKLKLITPQPVPVNISFALRCGSITEAEVLAAMKEFGPHTNAYVSIYMNESATKAQCDKAKAYPVGSIIVKQKVIGGHTRAATTKEWHGPKDGVGGMIKRAPGYDPEHGDWEYFFFEDIAKIEHGKIASCVNCHHGAKDKDHVFKAWATPSSAPANPHPNTR